MTTFQEAWSKASLIDGWLAADEAEWLFGQACLAPAGSIVEVGSYRGRSTVLLAQTGKNVIAVDPLTPIQDQINQMVITETDAYLFALNTKEYPILWFQEKSETAANKVAPGIGMLYIDGDHTHPQPQLDFEYFSPKLVPGAFVAFHDFGGFEGVTNTVLDLMQLGLVEEFGVVRSMWIGKIV